MLFLRRNRQKPLERMRSALWPTRSWPRSARYVLKRVMRISASPHTIALGASCGVAASMTPFIGFHIAIGVALAFVLGGNMLAAIIATAAGNPLTFPVIWAVNLKIGTLATKIGQTLGTPDPDMHSRMAAFSWNDFFSNDLMWPLLKTMLIGSFPVALIAGLVTYFLIARLVCAYRARMNAIRARRQANG